MATKRKRRKKASLQKLGLGDEKLMERLLRAAQTIGLNSVEELADLVVDSGVSARPPVDNLSERMSLEDLGARLHVVGASKPRDQRAEWFGQLVPVQQTAVVTTLRHRGYSALSISNDFGITEMDINRTWAENRTALGSQVLGVRLDTLVGSIWAVKERAQEGAMKKGDWATFWRVEKDATGVLQDLGVVARAAHRVEVVNQAEGVKAAALDRLVALAEKKAARREELKKVEASVVDELPEEIEASFQGLKET